MSLRLALLLCFVLPAVPRLTGTASAQAPAADVVPAQSIVSEYDLSAVDAGESVVLTLSPVEKPAPRFADYRAFWSVVDVSTGKPKRARVDADGSLSFGAGLYNREYDVSCDVLYLFGDKRPDGSLASWKVVGARYKARVKVVNGLPEAPPAPGPVPPMPDPEPDPEPETDDAAGAKVKLLVLAVRSVSKSTPGLEQVLESRTLRSKLLARGHVLKPVDYPSKVATEVGLDRYVKAPESLPALVLCVAQGKDKGRVVQPVIRLRPTVTEAEIVAAVSKADH